MKSVLRLSATQRAELYQATAQKSGLGEVIIEKDFWVCWTLRELFTLPGIGEHLIFKGGTSLSKVWRVIERFSEDNRDGHRLRYHTFRRQLVELARQLGLPGPFTAYTFRHSCATELVRGGARISGTSRTCSATRAWRPSSTTRNSPRSI
jgi:integrase